MALMLIVIGLGLTFAFNSTDKELLRKGAIRVEGMASRGHAMSVLHQKPFWIRFEQGRVILAGADVRSKGVASNEGAGHLEEERETHEEIYDTFEIGEAAVSVRRWGTQEDAWISPKEDTFEIWHFQSTGLCEPISIKLATEESYIIMHMNPLTARVDDEESSIR